MMVSVLDLVGKKLRRVVHTICYFERILENLLLNAIRWLLNVQLLSDGASVTILVFIDELSHASLDNVRHSLRNNDRS